MAKSEKDLWEVLGLFWRRRYLILSFGIVFLVLGLVVRGFGRSERSAAKDEVYEGKAVFFFPKTQEFDTQVDLAVQIIQGPHFAQSMNDEFLFEGSVDMATGFAAKKNISSLFGANVVPRTSLLELTYFDSDSGRALQVVDRASSLLVKRFTQLFNEKGIIVVEKAFLNGRHHGQPRGSRRGPVLVLFITLMGLGLVLGGILAVDAFKSICSDPEIMSKLRGPRGK